jgi:SAM-dependent methyltransferase
MGSIKQLLAHVIRQTSPAFFAFLKSTLRAAGGPLSLANPGLIAMARRSLHIGTGQSLKEDYLDRWYGQRDALTPPLRLLFDGTTSYAEFQQLGDGLRDMLVAHGLQPDHKVLEIGSGNGKNARALTQYVSRRGSYEGFDIVTRGVAWCQKNITPRYPHFRFRQADVYNRTYNPNGRCQAGNYRFPYESQCFDFVFLTSVFTHMLPAGLDNYIAEIARVLKLGGKCFVSFFLLTPESRAGLAVKTAGRTFPFEYESPCCRVADLKWPEDAVAFDEGFIRELFQRHGLHIEEPIRYGSWSHGHANGQDLVWAHKPTDSRPGA